MLAALGAVLALPVTGFGVARAAATAPVAAVPSPSGGAPDVVRVAQGELRGRAGATGRTFLGIPYAASPVGARRWQPPAPPSAWTGTRDATTAGSPCPQTASPFSTASTNEDCLFLNVHTPPTTTASAKPAPAGRPVMVWIHGGGFTTGAGSDYGATRLSTSGNVVVVTINYRLGALGFLALPELPASGSGAFGLLDQQAALRWVQHNIAAFGGDPTDVTIFGESAGAGSVCAQLVSPGARGLFTRAIAQSGCLLALPTLTTARAGGRNLATALACTGADIVACLRSRSVTDILAASGSSPVMSLAPATGTPVLPLPVLEAFTTGRFTRVPLLQGTNHDEGRLFVALGGAAVPTTPEQYAQAVAQLVGADTAPAVLKAYSAGGGATAVGDMFAKVLTDGAFSCPALRVDAALQSWVRTYGYEFDDPAAGEVLQSVLPPTDFPLRAAHGGELFYLFDLFGARLPESSQGLSAEMIGYWSRFATSGDPNGGGAATWTPLSARHQEFQRLAPPASGPLPVARFAADHQCLLWASLPLPGLL